MRYPDSRGVGSTDGFSMLEVLIAGAILLVIALGLIPVFAQAIRNNETGGDYLQATNGNKARLEESSAISVHHPTLTLPVGSTEGQVVESFAQGSRKQIGDAAEGWWAGAPNDKGQLLWTRTTRVHVYSVNALDQDAADFTFSASERQPGSNDPSDLGNHNLKEVEVVLESEKESSVFGGSKRTTFRLLKTF